MRWLLMIALVACGNAKVELDPVTAADANAFAGRWVAATAAKSCDPAKVATMIDDDAFRARVAAHLSSFKGELVAHQLGSEAAAKIVCAWQAQASAYGLLRVRTLDGEPRPLLRRLIKVERTGIVGAAYEDLKLGASRSDHGVRIIDMYSYVTGQWLSELLGDHAAALAASTGDAVDSSSRMQQAVALAKAGKPTEALALVDQLPPAIRRTRETQLVRVKFGQAISNAAHLQALDELAATFPDDPSIAMMEIDGAFLRSDWDAALHYIDVLDAAIGGDPFQNAIRAEAYLARKHPGDLELARARADAAIKAEPTLAKGWFATLDVALGQERWPDALAAMDTLSTKFGSTWDDAKLRTVGSFAGLVATPEYAAWLAHRQ